MERWCAIVTLLGVLGGPGQAAGGDIYSFVDGDGVIHVTNVPQDPRYRRVHQNRAALDGLHRIAIAGRPPLLLRRNTSFDEHIRAAADKYGLPLPLLKAVMEAESNFDPSALSDRGATGLMQLMPNTARELFVIDVYDPAQNIDGGARYLRLLCDQFGSDLEKVLAAYNAGPEAVRRAGGAIPPIPETQAYVRKVIALYEAYLRGR
jgi:soluble lytic murein transglycosylase-like protein